MRLWPRLRPGLRHLGLRLGLGPRLMSRLTLMLMLKLGLKLRLTLTLTLRRRRRLALALELGTHPITGKRVRPRHRQSAHRRRRPARTIRRQRSWRR